MHGERLAGVEDVGEVHVDAGEGERAGHTGWAAARDGGEARQDVQPGFEGVAQFVGSVAGRPAPMPRW